MSIGDKPASTVAHPGKSRRRLLSEPTDGKVNRGERAKERERDMKGLRVREAETKIERLQNRERE